MGGIIKLIFILAINFAIAYFISDINAYVPFTTFLDGMSGGWHGMFGPYNYIISQTINPDHVYQPNEYNTIYAIMWWIGAVTWVLIDLVWAFSD